MIFFVGTVALLAAFGDWRLLRAGAITGARRLARHLWRMCFGLFIASGSFFLGQMKFIPKPLRSFPLLLTLAVSPLVMLVYWMWRVRLRHNLRGMVTRKSAETFAPPVDIAAVRRAANVDGFRKSNDLVLPDRRHMELWWRRPH